MDHPFIKIKKQKNNQDNLISTEIKYSREKETKRKIYFWIALGFFCVLISVFLIFMIFNLKAPFISKQTKINKSSNLEKTEKEINSEDNVNTKERLIDGVYVKDGDENIFPLAIMIDNHSKARPPSGIDKANLVFEAEVEGGITRYLAIFASRDEIPEIGPIRSARPYFIDWVHEFSALYAHVGGSPEALVKIKQDNIFDINEFYNEHYFWRSNHFDRPHNVFTSSEKLRKYIREKKSKDASREEKGNFFPWKFKDDKSKDKLASSSKISIKFKLDAYAVDWVFDKENNNYIRYQNKKPHYVRSGEIINAKNIVIEYADATVIDDKLRLKMEVGGEGKALICLDGECREARWKKKTKASKTRYYIDGEEVEFNRGTTWVEVLRPEIKVVIN